MPFVPENELQKKDSVRKPAIRVKEPAEVVAFIDHYLALADALLSPNVDKEGPDQKSEPYVDHGEK